MKDPFRSERSGRWRQRLLAIDAWIDTALHESGRELGEAYEGLTAFMRRFKPEGIWRGFFEVASEGCSLSVAGALLMLALAIPAFDEVDSDWRTQSEYAVTFLDRYGNVVGRRGVLQDDSVELEDLPDHLVQAVLATEDRRFFLHFGIDFMGTFRAMVENARAGGVVQGGSSITQQLAKNLFLSNERTLQRKIKEAYLALWLEANLTKREILKLYLDRAYMGGGTTGVGAAAEFYFGKKVTDINLAESAMLAGLFKAPTRFYKTGVVFMAWLNGHQDHFVMVGGQQSARSLLHLAELFRLADQAGLLRDPDLAANRMRQVLRLHGLDG